ncbi:hypothetical protein PQG02_34985 (plasmid) [Nostoc sp. UHCC 0926]|uniref:hypothetical protein n=1 Tax=Nostoc sp. UHCC 0926 TaxID=3025190 RepID=UPI002361A0B7|nr:hypothetical protein [Nostoc sp. UHCC 0926]WDD37019.1 hypothetical protein PQG02_34985 [Nostoc sp. UHCC 0926]
MKKLDRKIADVTGASNRVVNEITSAGGNLISVRSTGNCYQKIDFTTLMKTMKTLLKRSALLLALPISVLVNFSLPASADSTAGIILSTKCQGGYNINIWQNYSSGELLYRATNPNGHLSLGKGTKQATEGVRVYKFRNRNYQYWVWDGTLDSPQSGTLEVYKNNRILMRQTCRKN